VAVTVVNKSPVPAIFLTLDNTQVPGFFSQNVFFLLRDESKTVIFTSKHPVEDLGVVLAATTRVKSYNDMMNYV
jgi:hypothetical protein